MISLIDSYMQKTKQDSSTNVLNEKEQNKFRTNVRAYRPIGHLIHPNPLSLRDAFDSDKRSLQYFRDGIKGHGNDYSIGKINDLTIKLGSLGIAGLIATGKGSPLQKGMEFVGLGCWLGAMHLWPKLAINAPIKALKGVDLNLEYETSSGRRKSFYQDPQFICWDMISDEEMNKMGDKLGIPKNIKNRRKAIENKARQVAIQGNTLALLTAGLTTPLIASLAADQLSKHAVYPLLNKLQDRKAENLKKGFAKHLLPNLSDYPFDVSADKIINEHVKANMSVDDINAIKKLFKTRTTDLVLKDEVPKVLNGIFDIYNLTNYSIQMTENTPAEIAKLIIFQRNSKNMKPPLQLVEEVLKDFKNEAGTYDLNLSNINAFISKLERAINKTYRDHHNISADAVQYKIMPNIRKYLNDRRNVTLESPELIKETIKQMFSMTDVFQKHYGGQFREQYLRAAWYTDVSTQSSIWRNISNEFLKIFKLSNSELKKLLIVNNTDEITDALGGALDKITSNQTQYEKTMKRLAKFAEKMADKNHKFLPNSLNYIDDLTDMFANAPRKTDLEDYAEVIKTQLLALRVNILNKYIGTNVTLYSPIRTMAILKEAKPKLLEIAGNNGARAEELYSAVKDIMLNFHTTDAFMGKLTHLKEVLPDDEELKKVLDVIFAKLPESSKDLMDAKLYDKINDTTTVLKGLLFNLNDSVIDRFGPVNNDKLTKALRNLDLYKYVDDLFFTRIINKDAVIENIIKVTKENPEKLNLLQNIFSFTSEDMKAIASGDWTCLKNSNHFNDATYLARDLFTFFGRNDIDIIGGISIGRTKPSQTSGAMGKVLKNNFTDAAQEMLNYKGWFKKVGIAFIAVCGITAFAISQIGKKNEFNPDKYEERSKA